MFQKRVIVIVGFIAAVFFVIVIRLFALQVIENSYYRTQARKYATRIELIADPRGKVLDRNGNVLVSNKLAFDLFITPAVYLKPKTPAPKAIVNNGSKPDNPKTTDSNNDTQAQEEILRKLSNLLNIKYDLIASKIKSIQDRIAEQAQSRPEREQKRFTKQQYRNRFRIFSGLTLNQAMQIESHPEIFRGFNVSETISRHYLHNDLACHIIGYVGPIWKEEYDQFIENGYFDEMLSPEVDENTYQALIDMGEFKNISIGRSGLEKQYDRLFTGRYGVRLSEYDYASKQKEELSRTESVPPADIMLTIDLDLQKKLESALKGKTGAGIVMDVNTGEILAMASAPSFDPNRLQPPVDAQMTEFIAKSPLKPLYNRAISGEYPPGSVFKIVTALAALEEGKVTPFSPFHCNGYFSPKYKKFKCWIAEHNREHGTLAVEDGFKHSCNVYFFHAGNLAGGEAITRWARNMGFGERSGIDVAGEKKGRVPKPLVDKDPKTGRPKWPLADTLNMSIGQGDLMVTPLQVVRMVAAVANGGTLVRPRIIKTDIPKEATDKNAEAAAKPESLSAVSAQAGPNTAQKVSISESTLSHIRNGMYKVVHSEGGTAHGSGVRNFPAAGKTGTAEVWGRKSHAWFAGFAPFDRPRIAFVVVVEYGGKGSEVSAPVVAAFLPEALEIYSPSGPK
ncbi:MAG: penicillin-binding protein 2 [Planctomycetota bacterium]